jgi:hypothetical protein
VRGEERKREREKEKERDPIRYKDGALVLLIKVSSK